VGFAWAWTLIACLKESKAVNLMHKVGEACPSPQSKANHKNKSGHKSTDAEHIEPVLQQLRWSPH